MLRHAVVCLSLLLVGCGVVEDETPGGAIAVAAVLSGCLLIAFANWLPGGKWLRIGKWASIGLALALLASPPVTAPVALVPATDSERYSPARLEELRAAGSPVFVNVTADWCITCIANERGTLSSERVARAMADLGMEYIVVDWTDYDPGIAAFLARFGRNGVPLYLVYSGQSGTEPEVLPQLLTPGIVLNALERSRTATQKVAGAGGPGA